MADSGGKRGRPGLGAEKAARVLVDAIHLGDKKAAKKHRCGVRTVERYRQRQQSDERLRALVQTILAKDDELIRPKRVALQRERADFQSAGLDFAQAVMAKGHKLLDRCTSEQFPQLAAALRDVSEAIRNVGEIDLAAEVLGVGGRNRRTGEAPAETGDASDEEGAD